jgi:hypothetical protein
MRRLRLEVLVLLLLAALVVTLALAATEVLVLDAAKTVRLLIGYFLLAAFAFELLTGGGYVD